MAQGDKAVIAIANRDSLKYKIDRQYGIGSVILRNGMFYEANGEVPAGTTFAEGSTGATWKVVGGIPDWVQTNPYTVGARVFHNDILWEANGNIAANTTFSEGTTGATWKAIGKSPFTPEFSTSITFKAGDRAIYEGHEWEYTNSTPFAGSFSTSRWTRKIGLVDGKYFGSVKNISNATTGVELDGDYLLPETADTLNLGDLAKPLACVYSQRYRFSISGTYIGEIDADSNNLEINSSKPIQFKPDGETGDYFKLESDKLTAYKPFVIQNNQGLIIKDGDATESGREAWKLDIGTNNGLNFNYLSDSESATNVLSIERNGSTDFRILPKTTDVFLGQNTDTDRYTRLYVENSTSVSSDKRLKKDIQDIPDKLLDTWFDYVKPKSYLLKKESCNKSGRSFGVIAQDVISAFDAAGLDWREWGVIEEGEDESKHLSVVYDYLQIIEMAAIRRKLGF